MVDVYILLIVLANVLFYIVSLACVWLMRRRVQRLETDDARVLREALISEYVTTICCSLLNCIAHANVIKHHHMLLSRFGLIARRPQNIVLMRRRGTIVCIALSVM